MNQTLTHYSIELFANKMPCFSLNNTHLLYVPFFFKKSHTKAEHVKGKTVCTSQWQKSNYFV